MKIPRMRGIRKNTSIKGEKRSSVHIFKHIFKSLTINHLRDKFTKFLYIKLPTRFSTDYDSLNSCSSNRFSKLPQK